MREILYVPEDLEKYRKLYEPKGKGVCGIACLSVILGKSLATILDEWNEEIGPYDGHTRNRDLRKFLEYKGFKVKQRGLRKGLNISLRPNTLALCRVQWKGTEGGDFHGYKLWIDATRNTHLIVVSDLYIFCNSVGWFNRAKLLDYLQSGNGYLTSYLEIDKLAVLRIKGLKVERNVFLESHGVT